ncbi:hypothetical protein ACEWY4_026748 [Coilia grayii]|uniref:RUN and FYVE domain-containing protein 1 n=1 Tax=Coilia grayii TaxID=363190 RepID=A0ABD1IRJ6_9TELE
MAEEAQEPNSFGEDSNVDKGEESDVSGLVEDGKEHSIEEEQKNRHATESTWSAPILSLARKASETISSGVNTYGAALKNAAPGTATNSSELSAVSEIKSTAVKDPVAVERSNLLSMMKLSVKVLIQSSLSLGRTLDSDYPPLQQFFVVLEHCLKHGLKVRKSFISQNKSIWGPLELIEKLCPESCDIATSVRDMPGLKTGLGRARAWLHLALMQKKLADYMKALIDRKDLLGDFYEPGALMLEEEGTVIVGMLVGLNVIDANLCVKGEDLDSQVGVIDFSLYLKDPQSSETTQDDEKMTAILDQKHYIEELNRHLSCTVTDLQAKMDALEKTNFKLIEELTAATDRINSLRDEQEQLREENANILQTSQKKEEATLQDSQVELETYRQTRQGLDEMYNVVWKQYKEEKRIRQELEKELELQVGLKQEMEVAMKLLEKDIHEKQDSLGVLRHQLDQVKSLNLQMFNKAQETDRLVRKKEDDAVKLAEKMNSMEQAMKELEQRLVRSEQARRQTDQCEKDMRSELEGKVEALQQQLADLDSLRLGLECDLRSEKEHRQGLQRDLQREQDNSTELRTQLQQLQGLQKVSVTQLQPLQGLQKVSVTQLQLLRGLQKVSVTQLQLLRGLQKVSRQQLQLLQGLQKVSVTQLQILRGLQKVSVTQLQLLQGLQKVNVRQMQLLQGLQKVSRQQLQLLQGLQKKVSRQQLQQLQGLQKVSVTQLQLLQGLQKVSVTQLQLLQGLQKVSVTQLQLLRGLQKVSVTQLQQLQVLQRRAEREAMKREAQRQREEAARVTTKGLDCGLLADHIHLPIVWPLKPQFTTLKEDLVAPGPSDGQPKASSNLQHLDLMHSMKNLVDEDLLPATTGTPQSLYCSEVSKPISPSQRAEREAMKREAQRQREEAARVTSKGLDSGLPADRKHLPIVWPLKPQFIILKEDLVAQWQRETARVTSKGHKQDGTCQPQFMLGSKPPSYHCSEVSKPISPSQRAEREDMKREAQRQREEAARVTSRGLDCSLLADRVHLPIVWPLEPQFSTVKEEVVAPGANDGQPKASSISQHLDVIHSPNNLVNEDLLPATTGATHPLHCLEVSKPICPSQRADREAMKREAQRQREEAARVTTKGLDCGLLADRIHVPILWHHEPQFTTLKEDVEAPDTLLAPPKVNSYPDPMSSPSTVMDKDMRAMCGAKSTTAMEQVPKPGLSAKGKNNSLPENLSSVMGRKRKGPCDRNDTKECKENPPKKRKVLAVTMMEQREVGMARLNPSNRPPAAKKLKEKSTAVSTIATRPMWKWTRVDSKSSLDKTTVKPVRTAQKSAAKKEMPGAEAVNHGLNNRPAKLSQVQKHRHPKAVTSAVASAVVKQEEEKKPLLCQGEGMKQRHSIRPHNQKPGPAKPELLNLQQEKKQLQQTCEEQEQALQEMGLHLSQSKLKMEDFKEVNKALKGHAWLKDDEATHCKQCQKEFSISRRKHHCRNCGDIYCNSCSGNELALPSYPKPVRVCDICHSLLLQRSTSTGS